MTCLKIRIGASTAEAVLNVLAGRMFAFVACCKELWPSAQIEMLTLSDEAVAARVGEGGGEMSLSIIQDPHTLPASVVVVGLLSDELPGVAVIVGRSYWGPNMQRVVKILCQAKTHTTDGGPMVLVA